MTQAAIYARISRDAEKAGLGVQRQQNECRQLVERLDAEVAEVLVDNDLSASTRSRKPRPAYEKLLAGARAGKWSLIVAWSSSRLTRRPLEHEALIDLAERYGTRYAFVKSPSFDLGTAQGRMIARQLAAVDAAEAEMTAERLRAQKAQAAASGQWRGGRRPYGYQDDGVTLEPAEAGNIAWATRQVLLGASLRSLAAELNTAGATTSTGRRWTSTELRRVLVRARNAGLVEHRGEVVAEAAWEPNVTRAEWEACRRVLRNPSRRTTTGNARRWLGSNLYLCGVCGATCRCTTAATGRPGMGPYYSCNGLSKHVARRADYTDEVVTKAVLGWLNRPEVVQQIMARDPVDTEALERQATELNNQLDEAADMYATRVWTRPRVEKITAKIRAELAEVEEKLVQAVSDHPAADLIGAEDIEAAWEALDISRKRAIVDALMIVTLLPARRGRPAGWKPGQRYFEPETVQIEWR